MKPAPFDYAAARSVDEAVELLAQYGQDCRVMAGGQSLMAMMNLRTVRPAVIVDISKVKELTTWFETEEGITIGAMVRQRQLETDEKLRAAVPLLAIAIHSVGHSATRSRGTIVGSLCHADPAAEMPVCAVTMQATLLLQSKRGTREVPADEFFTGIFSTAAGEDEMVTAVRFPRLARRSSVAFEEIARRHGDFAMASAACILDFEATGAIKDVRLVFGGVGDVPVRGIAGEKILTGTKATEKEIDAAAKAAADTLEPYDDIHATADYRKAVAVVLAERVLSNAVSTQIRS